MESQELVGLIKTQTTTTMAASTEKVKKLFSLLEQNDKQINQNTFDPMAKFWQSFIDMVQVLLNYILNLFEQVTGTDISHPEIYKEFRNGNFSTKRTKGNCNLLPPDQVIEQTITKNQRWYNRYQYIDWICAERWVLTSHTQGLTNVFRSLNVHVC